MASNPRPPRRKPTPRVAGRQHTGSGRPDVTRDSENEQKTPVEAAESSRPPVETGGDDPVVDSTTPTRDEDGADSDADAGRQAGTDTGVADDRAGGEAAADADSAAEETAVGQASDAAAAPENEADDVDNASDDGESADTSAPTAKTRPVSRVSTLRPTETAATRDTAAPAAKSAASTSSGRGFGNTTIGVLLAVAAVLGVFAVIAGLHPGADIGSNKAFVDQAATTELTSQVKSKACSLTVDTVDVDKWAAKARSALTGEALTEFDKYLPQQRQILGQTKAVADCRVESVGVNDLTGGGDGATGRVVVNLIVSQQQAGVAGQSAAPRYQFSMAKHGDEWLISKVEAF
ncbi:hypothetical protein AAFP35_04995 [Gordonia sp. CPCC 206044]|uniref:hypothetical protein n=1 Tax=Gordonia sp. CPCC 206044 TaxID=3140793 RepID=UPI003AF3C7C9